MFQHDGSARLTTVWDLLGGAHIDGKRAVVADDGTGFWEAVSAAELLGDAGLSVALVTPARSVGAAIPFESIDPLLRRLGQRRVSLHPLVHVNGIRNGSVTLVHALTGDPLELPADFVAMHAGTISNDGLAALPRKRRDRADDRRLRLAAAADARQLGRGPHSARADARRFTAGADSREPGDAVCRCQPRRAGRGRGDGEPASTSAGASRSSPAALEAWAGRSRSGSPTRAPT